MSDWGRHLPLSNRPRRDESQVTGDRARPTAASLHAIADALDARPDLLAADTLIDGVTVEWALRRALTRMRWSVWQRMLATVGILDAPSDELAAVESGTLSELLRVEAADRLAGHRRTGVRALGEVVTVALDLAHRHGVTLGIDADAIGAVALDLAVRQPTDRRAVLQARALRAIDGGWQVGTGRPFYATGAGIVLFLAGRTGLPNELPEPPAAPPRDDD